MIASTNPDEGRVVFISYSTTDKAIADRVCHLLEQDGIRCWIAPRDVLAGRSYAEQIIASLEQADGLVLVLSNRSAHSPHVRREAEQATIRDIPIVPFQIERTEIPQALRYFLGDFHRLDACAGPLDVQFQGLVISVRSVLPAAPRARNDRSIAPPPPVERTVSAGHPENYNPFLLSSFALRKISGDDVGTIYALNRTRLIAGRSTEADIYLREGYASRATFSLNWDEALKTFVLADFGARTGVQLNGVRLSQPAALDVGDVLTVGDVQWIFEHASGNPLSR